MTAPLASIEEWPGTTPATTQEEKRYENSDKEPINGWLQLNVADSEMALHQALYLQSEK